MIKLVEGDILDYPLETDALVNPVNCVGSSGAGLALSFKKSFSDNYKQYVNACNEGLVVCGKMFITETKRAFGSMFIINFPTKDHWKNNSEYSYIRDGLEDLVIQIKKRNIKCISIPALGVGLGGLEWNTVHKMIRQTFSNEKCLVRLYKPHKNN